MGCQFIPPYFFLSGNKSFFEEDLTTKDKIYECLTFYKHQPHKLVKHTQTIRRQQSKYCLSVLAILLRWRLKG